MKQPNPDCRDCNGSGKYYQMEDTNCHCVIDDMPEIIIGQECICPDGLGRVAEVEKGAAGSVSIWVDTYKKNRGCKWDSCNVTLINPRIGTDTNYIMTSGDKEPFKLGVSERRFMSIGTRTGVARTREEAVERIHQGLDHDLAMHRTWHYGKIELRDLMDFIYGEKPQNEKQEIRSD